MCNRFFGSAGLQAAACSRLAHIDISHLCVPAMLSCLLTYHAPHRAPATVMSIAAESSVMERVLQAVRQTPADEVLAEEEDLIALANLGTRERVLLAVRQDAETMRQKELRERVLRAVRQQEEEQASDATTAAVKPRQRATVAFPGTAKTWRESLAEKRAAALQPRPARVDRNVALRAVRQSSAIVPAAPAPTVPATPVPATFKTWREALAEQRVAALKSRPPPSLPAAEPRAIVRSSPAPLPQMSDWSWRRSFNGRPQPAKNAAPPPKSAVFERGVVVPTALFKTKATKVEAAEAKVMATVGAPTEDDTTAENVREAAPPKSSPAPQTDGAWVPVVASREAGAAEVVEAGPDLAEVEVWYGTGI